MKPKELKSRSGRPVPPIVELVRMGGRTVEGDGGCWCWQGSFNVGGVPVINLLGRGMTSGLSVRRAIAGELGIYVAPGSRIVPRCGEHSCVNPAHFKVLTASQYATHTNKGRNRALISAKQRATTKNAKVREHVGEIRRRLQGGERSNAIARDYGVSPTCINHIKSGRSWPQTSPWSI